ncbi:MAG: hypothetical protein AAF805_00235 [Planctomycetota bacterium]
MGALLQEDITLQIDTAHTSGGAWGTATWATLTGCQKVEPKPGIRSGMVARRGQDRRARRSKGREPSLEIESYIDDGNAAFDRLRQAAEDNANGGAEILHCRVVYGDPEDAGNRFWEADFVVTEDGGPSGGESADPSVVGYTLHLADDSPNAPATGVTS